MVSARRSKAALDTQDSQVKDAESSHVPSKSSPKKKAADSRDDSPKRIPIQNHAKPDRSDKPGHDDEHIERNITSTASAALPPNENLQVMKNETTGTKSLDLKKNLKNNEKKDNKKHRNELTKLVPGYTAPMKLNTSSLDRYRAKGGLAELQYKAARSDSSTRKFLVDTSSHQTSAMVMKKPSTAHSISFKKGAKRKPDGTAGSGWFGMVPTPMTEELKTDLALIRNRAYLDPKRFYKSADKPKDSNLVQVGTVIEGAAEFYSSRLTKKQRRANLTEEILADSSGSDYAKNKFKKMEQVRSKEHHGRKKRYRQRRGKRGHF